MIEQKKIPSGWIKTTVGEILEFEYGKGLISELRDNTGTYPVFGSNGFVGNHTSYLIEGPCIIVGRKGAAGAVHYSEKHCWPIDTTYFIRKLDSLNLKFYYYLLGSLNLNSLDKSTAIPGLNRNDAYSKSILLPPLLEQNRIVTRIEEIFLEIDNGIRQLISAQQQLKIYRQAILKNAFEGKLTEGWRKKNKLEPSEKLLKRIQKDRQEKHEVELLEWKRLLLAWERKDKKGTRPEKPQANKEFLPINKEENKNARKIPKEWIYTRLGELANYINGKTFKSQDWKSSGIPIIRIQNLKNDKNEFNYIDFDQKVEQKYIIEKSDLLFAWSGTPGTSFGAHVWKQKKAYLNQHIFKVENFIGVNKYFLYHALNFLVTSFIEKSQGTAGLAHITKFELENTMCPLPSSEEQNEIVNLIDKHFAIIDSLIETIKQGISKSDLLKKSILNEAFKGKLVPQNPKDESAAELLKRIKIEKEVTKKSFLNINTSINPKKMKKNLTIKEVLQTSKSPMNAKDVWLNSKHKDNIEDFYAELKKIQNDITEIKKGKESLLSLIK